MEKNRQKFTNHKIGKKKKKEKKNWYRGIDICLQSK
jgi:hypothetical protein